MPACWRAGPGHAGLLACRPRSCRPAGVRAQVMPACWRACQTEARSLLPAPQYLWNLYALHLTSPYFLDPQCSVARVHHSHSFPAPLSTPLNRAVPHSGVQVPPGYQRRCVLKALGKRQPKPGVLKQPCRNSPVLAGLLQGRRPCGCLGLGHPLPFTCNPLNCSWPRPAPALFASAPPPPSTPLPAAVSFAHGANDVANAVGPFAAIYGVYNTGAVRGPARPAPDSPSAPGHSLRGGTLASP
jgi:hypothetical protein